MQPTSTSIHRSRLRPQGAARRSRSATIPVTMAAGRMDRARRTPFSILEILSFDDCGPRTDWFHPLRKAVKPGLNLEELPAWMAAPAKAQTLENRKRQRYIERKGRRYVLRCH